MEHLSAVRQVCPAVGQATRCSSDQAKHEAKRAAGFNGHGFLRHRFQTHRVTPYSELMEWQKVESDFFKSLSNLCRLYNLPVPDVSELPYPLNISRAFKEIKLVLDDLRPNLKLMIVHGENHRATLATVRTYSIGFNLSYIPVGMVYQWWKDGKKPKMTRLVLSIFSYLYKVLEIPYYSESCNYMAETYESMEQWLLETSEDDEDVNDEWLDELLNEFENIRIGGQQLLAELKRPTHQARFEYRTNHYIPHSKGEKILCQASRKLRSIQKDYPNRSLFKSIPSVADDPDENDTCLYGDMYVSFYWGCESEDINNSLWERLDSFFAEFDTIEEPTAVQYFNKVQLSERHPLDFEERVFEMLGTLCTSLYNLQDEIA